MANNYKVKMVDLQNKYKFKIFCSSQMYDDTDLKREVEAIYKAFPKASATGTDATLNGTAAAIMNIDLKGNTSQYSTTGKNLLPNKGETKTQNGITFTKNEDGSVKVSGVATADASYNLITRTDTPFPAGTYTLNGCPSGGSTSTYYLYVSPSSSSSRSDTGSGTSFTLQANETNIVSINIKSGTNLSSAITFYPMLRLSSITDATYEPYTNGASPNPDYPQEVKNVTGDNTINIIGKNLFDEEYELGTINYDTGALESSTTIIRTKNYQTIKPSTQYTLKVPNEVTGIILYYYNNGSYIGGLQPTIGSTTHTITFTTNANANQMKWRFNSNYITLENETMFEIGTTFTTYKPYQSQSYSVNLGSLELCKIGDYQDYIYKEGKKWYLYKKIGKVVYEGTTTIDLSIGGITHKCLYRSNYPDGKITTGTNGAFYERAKYITNASERAENTFYENPTNYLIIGTPTDTLDTLKTKFNGGLMYYPLATPTTTEITDATLISQLNALRNAESYEGTTNISQVNSDMPFIFTASAIKDLSNL